MLDDYSPLRKLNSGSSKDYILFDIKEALQYAPIRSSSGSKGTSFFKSKNPPYGAIFTYNLPKAYETLKQIRKRNEAKLDKENKDVPFPGWEKLDAELNENPAKIVIEIRDKNGEFVDRVPGTNKKGVNRIAWSLTKPIVSTISSDNSYRGYRLSVKSIRGLQCNSYGIQRW